MDLENLECPPYEKERPLLMFSNDEKVSYTDYVQELRPTSDDASENGRVLNCN